MLASKSFTVGVSFKLSWHTSIVRFQPWNCFFRVFVPDRRPHESKIYIYIFFFIIILRRCNPFLDPGALFHFRAHTTLQLNDENAPMIMLRVLARGLLKIKFKRTGSVFVCEPLFETTTMWSVSVMLRRISVAPVKALHCNFFNNVLFSTGGYYDVGPVPARFQCFD